MRHFQDDTLIIKRLKTISGSRRTYVTTATAAASVQPLGKTRGQLDAGVYGHQYVAYIDHDIPAYRGGKAVDQNGDAYIIKEVTTRDFGAFPFKELLLERTKS